MKFKHLIFTVICTLFCILTQAQVTIKGLVIDSQTGEPLIGASVALKGTITGTVTDYEGNFELKDVPTLPSTLTINYIGYVNKDVVVNNANERLKIQLAEDAVIIEAVEVQGQRISDKQKETPLTVEAMDLLAIKAAPTLSFYEGLGSMKGVDLTTASLGFTIINTRGFNSTSPVRSLQIIDGVDNQAPGLNFSLGNFLGSSELDVLKVDLVVGASSAYYGPNAFNGVVSMQTKNPFIQPGLAVSLKGGERNLLETAVRWADAFKNKDGNDYLAYKLNFFYLRAHDWEADNYDPVTGTTTGNIFQPKNNPGQYDAVNIYGDEWFALGNFSTALWTGEKGLGVYHRTGYRETDMVDYNMKNIKANAAVHFRTQPAKGIESPEFIVSSSFGSGTTVYQGDNRFSLRNILFFQNRLEFMKRDKYFVRAYATNEDSGDSFDPYFTALKLQNSAKNNEAWYLDYRQFWVDPQKGNFAAQMDELGYPQLLTNPTPPPFFTFDSIAMVSWMTQYQDSLFAWHQLSRAFADMKSNEPGTTTQDFFAPGTDRFQQLFNDITSRKSNSQEGGTRFFDKSALYHVHGEYTLQPKWFNNIVVGANARLYTPYSEGTIFRDTNGVRITNFEYGAYAGVEKKFYENKIKVNATLRLDKNQNFDYTYGNTTLPFGITPAASIVYTVKENNYLRLSYSAATRNPTLTDQYLNLNVGRATLVGNLVGFDSLITVESFQENRNTGAPLVYFNAPPIRPERVQTFEAGYRTTVFKNLFADLGYYYNIYDAFIGYNIGIKATFGNLGLPDYQTLKVYRLAANSLNTVTTQGFSIGLNYYFAKYFMLSGNYSWNKLNKTFADDPIIPAFNTPEHKYNIGISGRDVHFRIGETMVKNFGFSLNYKWIQGFTFEGSPQFTGYIPTYDLLDGQVNYTYPKWNTTLKIGASNMLNKKQFQAYGGPRIGRMAYIAIVYDFFKK
ncbi:MAG: TonB-dependent receptor [Saprospiraceae bacterium]|nr:TonB-dependent receptor [Saprospiraceae bacterium]MBP7680060.1 TonB-dependent receptor [Saprospiraceae bacterium]